MPEEGFGVDEPTKTSTPLTGDGEGSPRIGPYRVLRAIGEGGMGVVYEAEQEAPVRRRVALKLVKWGMDTKEVIARFESERQALAMMTHPSIARVYDAGATPEGRPYFAMEYISGIPITAYCDTNRLTIRERLRLFMGVCQGIQHAHQKGIIHRDIKPSNVLVTDEGGGRAPKIIDFGVAKAISQRLTDHTVHTALGQLIGTPEYMSPEQAEMTNLDIDTRTDVYSLGVLLYELLAGQLPFDSKELRRAGLPEIQRRLREDDPPTPSRRFGGLGPASSLTATNRQADIRALQRELLGELDWITMKALEKDRARRYETAHALARDVERYLNDEPVLAGPTSPFYRAGKFVKRHRAGVVAAACFVLALLAGVVGTSWALLRAVRAERVAAAEAAEARRQTAIAEAVNGFLNEDLLASVAPSAARGRGKDVTMREVLEAAGERLDRDSRQGSRFADQPLVEASIRVTLGQTHRQLGAFATAEPHLRRALELRRQELGEGHERTGEAMNQMGLLLSQQGRAAEAEPLLRGAIEIAARALGPDHRNTLAYEANLAHLLRSEERYPEAEALYERNLEARRRTLGAEHADTLDTMSSLANQLQETGRYEKAEALHRQVFEANRKLRGESSLSTIAAMSNLANDLSLLGRFEEAGPLMRRAWELKVELYGADHPSTLNSVNNLAELLAQQGRDAEAEPLHRRALEGRTRGLGARHVQTLHSMERLASTLANRERFGEAERLAAAAATASEEVLGPDAPSTLHAQDTRARALVGLGRAEQAEALLRRQLELLQAKKARGDDLGEADDVARDMRVHLGMALAAQGRRTEAEALLLEALPGLPAREAGTARAIRFLLRLYEDWNRTAPDPGRSARAAEWRGRLAAGETAGVPPP